MPARIEAAGTAANPIEGQASRDALRKEIRAFETRIRDTRRSVRSTERELNAVIKKLKEIALVYYGEQKGLEAHEQKKRCTEGLDELKISSRAYLAQQEFGLASAKLRIALDGVEQAAVELRGILGGDVLDDKTVDPRALLAAIGEAAWKRNEEAVSGLRRTRLEAAVTALTTALRDFELKSGAFLAVLDDTMEHRPGDVTLSEKRDGLNRVRNTVISNGSRFLDESGKRLTLFRLVSALRAAKRVDVKILKELHDGDLIGGRVDADTLIAALKDAERRARSAQPTGAAPFA